MIKSVTEPRQERRKNRPTLLKMNNLIFEKMKSLAEYLNDRESTWLAALYYKINLLIY